MDEFDMAVEGPLSDARARWEDCTRKMSRNNPGAECADALQHFYEVLQDNYGMM